MSECSPYETVDQVHFVLAGLLAIGIFLSYVPQHLRIIQRHSSEGLSPAFLLLGSSSSLSALVNISLMTAPARQCCRSVLNAYQCSNALMGLVQVAAQAAGCILILVLCVYTTNDSIEESRDDYGKLLDAWHAFIAYFLVTLFASICIANTRAAEPFANLMGLLSTFLSLLQCLPQIYTTWKAKHPGSLSVAMMCIQVPGGFLWAYSLYSQPGSRWSSWLPFFSAACLQLVLLCLCIYLTLHYNVQASEADSIAAITRQNTRNDDDNADDNDDDNDDAVSADESTPLTA